MKILYIITQEDGGGEQQYVLSLAKHFGGAIAAGTEDSMLFDAAQASGLEVYKLNHLKRNISPWHDWLAIFEIRGLVRKLKPEIVHLNSTKAGFLGSIAAKLAGAKVIFTAHGFKFLEPLSPSLRAFYLATEKLAGSYRDFIIAVSDVDKESAIENNLINKEKITTIYNGLPAIDFLSKADARKKLNFSNDKFIFGTIANFYKTKGLDVLIDAISKLEDETKFEFVIVGSGSEERYLKAISNNLKAPLHFLGNIPNAKIYLKAFDTFILSSRKEGFPFV